MAETQKIIDLIRILRNKCPWDKKQKLKNMPYLFIEESYELLDALQKNDRKKIIEEIGDLLFLALMTAVIAEIEIDLKYKDLCSKVVTKYRERHPHVFGSSTVRDDKDVLKKWGKLKDKGPFADIPKILPALVKAKLIQERAAHFGFDWKSITGPLEKVTEEVGEIVTSDESTRAIEFGDLFFSLVNIARFLKIDPESALKMTCDKFQKRFQKVLEEVGPDADLEEMDRIWTQVKDD